MSRFPNFIIEIIKSGTDWLCARSNHSRACNCFCPRSMALFVAQVDIHQCHAHAMPHLDDHLLCPLRLLLRDDKLQILVKNKCLLPALDGHRRLALHPTTSGGDRNIAEEASATRAGRQHVQAHLISNLHKDLDTARKACVKTKHIMSVNSARFYMQYHRFLGSHAPLMRDGFGRSSTRLMRISSSPAPTHGHVLQIFLETSPSLEPKLPSMFPPTSAQQGSHVRADVLQLLVRGAAGLVMLGAANRLHVARLELDVRHLWHHKQNGLKSLPGA